MEPWVRSYVFLEGSSYQNELRKYNEFLIKNKDKNILFLELGVGSMTPMFIKEPFWNMTYSFPNAYYITINPKDALVPQELREKGLAIKEDIAHVLQDVVNNKEKREADIGKVRSNLASHETNYVSNIHEKWRVIWNGKE